MLPRQAISTPSAWRFRSVLKWLHLWLGLSVGLVFAVVSLTGTVLAFQSELLLAAHPELERERLPPLALQGHALARIVAEAEDSGIRSVDLPSPRLPAWQAFAANGERHYFDPANGDLLLVRNTGNDAVMWMRDLHAHLLAGEAGEQVLGASGIVALFLLLSGLYLWWPRLAALAASLRWHAAPPPRRWLSWHRSLGVFLLPLLLVVTFTGVAMVYSQPFRSALRWTFGDGPEVVPPSPIERETTSIDWKAVLLAAVDAAPRGSDLRRISLPKGDDALVSIRFRAPGEWHPNGRSVVWVDPYRASAVQVHDATAQDAGARISDAMYPLHGGFVGGRAWQWAIAAAGLLPAFLLATGFLFWRARRRRH